MSAMPEQETVRLPKRKRSGTEKRQRGVLNTFRSSKEERDEMHANAAAAGLSFGSFMRSLGVIHPRTRAVHRPSPDTQLIAQLMAQVGRIGGNLAQFLKLANRGEIILDRNDLTAAVNEARAFIAAAQKALRSRP